MKELRRLTPVYLEFYKKEGEKAVPFFIESTLPSLVMMIEYKHLPGIETLPSEEKRELVEYIQKIYPDGTKEFIVKSAKIIYTLGILLEV